MSSKSTFVVTFFVSFGGSKLERLAVFARFGCTLGLRIPLCICVIMFLRLIPRADLGSHHFGAFSLIKKTL